MHGREIRVRVNVRIRVRVRVRILDVAWRHVGDLVWCRGWQVTVVDRDWPLGSANKVSAIGYAKSYGEERLVVKIGDNFYQAGDDVESNVENLKLNSILKIEKICTRPARHTKYAVCSIYEPGDWTACMEFVKTPMLKNRDGSTCIVDVKTIDVRGKKRTLLLTDQGMVYRLKQSKLEDTVQPGYL